MRHELQEGIRALINLQDSIHGRDGELPHDQCFSDVEIARYSLALCCEAAELAEALGVLPWRSPQPIRQAAGVADMADVVGEITDVLLFTAVIARHVSARIAQLNADVNVEQLIAGELIRKAAVVQARLTAKGFTPEMVAYSNALADENDVRTPFRYDRQLEMEGICE